MNNINLYPGSAIIYILILTLCILLAIFANSKSNKTPKTFVFLIIVILSVFSGIRAPVVGIDTPDYFDVLYTLEEGFSFKIRNISDIGFLFLAKLILIVTNSPQVVLIIFAFITNGLIISTLWLLRQRSSFPYMVFFYISIFYISSFSGIRQWLALAIVFFCFRYILETRYFKFILGVSLAATIHTSALIALLYIPLNTINLRMISKRHKLGIIMTLIFNPIIFAALAVVILKTPIISKYTHLLDASYLRVNIGIMFFVQLLILLFSLIFIKKPRNTQSKYKVDIFTIVYLFGFLLNIPGYFYQNLGRISLYFLIFQVVFYSMISKHARYGLFFKVATITVALYTFYSLLADSGYGQMPFIPYWKYPY